MITVTWKTLGFVSKDKRLLLPCHAYNIHVEWGGWSSDKDIYLWWREYGIDKCRKIVSTQWKTNLKKVADTIHIKKESDAK